MRFFNFFNSQPKFKHQILYVKYELDAEKLFDDVIQSFISIGLEPYEGYIIGDFNYRTYPDKTLSFKKLTEILKKKNFQRLLSFSISFRFKVDKSLIMHMFFPVSGDNTIIGTTHITHNFSDNYELAEKMFLDIISRHYHIEYGLGFSSKNDYDGGALASGMLISNFPFFHFKHERREKLWFKTKNLITEGYIRDVFTTNFLREVHLRKIIFPNITLKQWILSDLRHGTLNEVKDGIWQWNMSDEYLKIVRRELLKTDIILLS